MKKILLSFTTIFLVVFATLLPIVYADDEETSVEFNFTSSATVNIGDETLTLVISLGDLSGIEDTSIMGFEAVLSFDDTIFDSVSVSGLNNWTVNYSSSTGKIVGDTTSGAENVDIAELKFVLNDDVETGETTVTLSDVLVTDGSNDFEFTKTCTVTISESSDEDDTDSETTDDTDSTEDTTDDTTEDTTDSTDTSTNESSNTSNTTSNSTSDENTTTTDSTSTNTDNTTSSESLPYTGTVKIVIIIIVILLVGGFFGMKWGKYIKDTKKQL